MSKKYIIANDIGSQSIKTAIYDEDGNIKGSVNQETHIIDEGNGGLVYDGDEVYKLTIKNIKSLLEISGVNRNDVEVISFSGMGGGIIGVDQEWNPTMKYSNPIDVRDHNHFIEMMRGNSHLIRKVSGTGNPMGANKLVWIKKDMPDVYKKTRKFMMLTQYVQGKFCAFKDDQAIWDFSSIALSGMADAENFKWSEEICSAIDIDIKKLPRVVEPAEVIGSLCRDASLEIGLVQGIPVVAGAFDKVCDTVGSGSHKIGLIVDIAATYPALILTVDRFVPDTEFSRLECHSGAERDKWLMHTYIIGGGLSHTWYEKEFISKNGYKRNDKSIFKELDDAASNLPFGSEGLIFFPHLGGKATPFNPDARGVWAGFTWNHNYAHFYRSILEGIAYEHALTIRATKGKFPEIRFTEARVMGGGAKSNVWNQIKADVLGIPYMTLNRSDSTTFGAALIGGKAVGVFKDLNEVANRIIKIKEVFKPRKKYHEVYNEYVNTFSSIDNDMKPIYKKLSLLRKKTFKSEQKKKS